MLIGVDSEGNIKQINNITDDTLKQIEVNSDKIFPGYSDIKILSLRYTEKEDGACSISLQENITIERIEKLEYQIEKEKSQATINSLGSQLVQEKISNMQKDSLIKNLGTQITQSKLENLQNKTINNYIGQQLVQAKLNLIKVQGGK